MRIKLLQFLSLATILTTLIGNVQSQVTPTPAQDRMKVNAQKTFLTDHSLLNDQSFRNIGPTIMGGRVVDLDVNAEDPTEFYVAYASGGVWHTTNNGQSLTPIFDQEATLTIGDIAVDWKTHTIWVGTGEVNSSRSTYAGTGMYKSVDRGKTWSYLGLPESHHIGKIQLHPTDPNTAWVAVMGHLYSPNKERGVFKTIDGGKTWQHALAIDNTTGSIDLEINPINPNELYAAAWYRTRSAWNFEEGGASSGIYKSIDGGNTWNKITVEGSGFPTGAGIGRIGLAIFPKSPTTIYAIVDNQTPRASASANKIDTNYKAVDFKSLTKEAFAALDDKKLDQFLRRNRMPAIYTALAVKEMVKSDKIKPIALFDYLNTNDGFTNTGIEGCQVYRSNDAGKTWSKTHEKEIGIYSTYGYYFGKIYVSAYNDQKVIIFGVPLQLSTDGGKTFTSIDKGNVHSDHHAVWINPKNDNHIINGNDGGANITYDNGANWFKINTPPVGQFYAVTTDDAKPYNVYGGLQDNNVWYGPSTNKESIDWIDNGSYAYKSLVGGDGMQVQVDTRDNKTTYAGSQFGVYYRLNRETLGDRVFIRPSHLLGETPLRFNWETPILLSRHNQDVLYFGSNRFHRSLNKGDQMAALSGDLTNGKKEGDVPYGTISCIAESPFKFGLLYTGTDDGNVLASSDGGYTWKKISDKLPQGLWISHITASQHKEGRVYVTLNGYRNDHFMPYLFMTEDQGNSWTDLSAGLPFEPLNVVREDPKYDSILYVGSDGGLYVSLDQGHSYMAWNKGMPRAVPVHDLAIQQRENELVVATHGRSLYISSLTGVQELVKDTTAKAKKEAEIAKNSTSITDGLFERSGAVGIPTPSKKKK